MPSLRPVIVRLSAIVPAWASMPPAGLEMTVYPVMADPPLSIGAWKLSVALPLPVTANPMIGARGTVFGTTDAEGDEAKLVPKAFRAVTVKV